MATGDGSAVITFNGEIYNFRALKSELGDVHFRSSSDTEVLLYGYQQWGTDVFRRANGMFAVAIWDKRERKLILARDRLGKKPLFYYWDGQGDVVFASELKALLAHPRVTRAIDQDSLALYFAFGYVPTPRTIFRNIYKVPQGSFITFRGAERAIDSYWDLPLEERSIKEADALDELDALLHDAVKLRLESDVPLGFFLSGGIDSTLVTAIGKRLGGDIQTFTVGFGDQRYDETPFARAIATYLRTKHTELKIEPANFADFLRHASRFYDEPFADSSLIATYYLARATKQEVTVALSGDGGDELFCGYSKYRDMKNARALLGLPHRLRSMAARALEHLPNDTSRKVGHALRSETIDDLIWWLISIWKPDEIQELMPGITADWRTTSAARTWKRFDTRDDLSRMMAVDIKSYLCDDILQKVDRASMAVSLEIRCPLLDYRLVEFAMSLPVSLKFRHGQQKYLLRELLAKHVPRQLWEKRAKHGLNVPVKSWYRNERQSILAAGIQELGSHLAGVLATEPIEYFMAQHLTGRYDYSSKLFCIEMLNSWFKEYEAQPPSAAR